MCLLLYCGAAIGGIGVDTSEKIQVRVLWTLQLGVRH